MKAFLFLLTSALAIGLSSAQTGVPDEARELTREANRIENDMFIQFPDLGKEDTELQLLAEKAGQAATAAQQAMDTHPALAELRLRKEAAYAKLMVIMGKGTKGDDAEKRSAQEVFSTADLNLKAKVRDLPEVLMLVEASATAKSAFQKRREVIYATRPETAEAAKKVAELRARAAELNPPISEPVTP